MVDLTPFNTLRIPARAKNLINVTSVNQLKELISQSAFQKPYLILGHGANVLFTHDFSGTVYKVNFSGIEVLEENSESVLIRVAAGQDWHQLVMWTVEKNLSGLENMALIPGTVGAAIVGNIAAYGQNQENVFESAKTLDLLTGELYTWQKPDCEYAYRESIFKRKEYKKYLIISANYRLSKSPQTNTSYHATRHTSLLQELERIRTSNNPKSGDAYTNVKAAESPVNRAQAGPRQRPGSPSTDLRDSRPYTVSEIAQAVINLRTAKLPDWTKISTAGSFFKNPVVLKTQADEIQAKIPDLQTYPTDKLTYIDPSESDKYVKLPAGMLLDELGWRGKSIGHVSTSPTHALIIINAGGTGEEVYAFSEQMRSAVKSAYNIDLEYEVVII